MLLLFERRKLYPTMIQHHMLGAPNASLKAFGLARLKDIGMYSVSGAPSSRSDQVPVDMKFSRRGLN